MPVTELCTGKARQLAADQEMDWEKFDTSRRQFQHHGEGGVDIRGREGSRGRRKSQTNDKSSVIANMKVKSG